MSNWLMNLENSRREYHKQKGVVEQIERTIEQQKEALNQARGIARRDKDTFRRAQMRYDAHMMDNHLIVGPHGLPRFHDWMNEESLEECIERWTPVWDSELTITKDRTMIINGKEEVIWKSNKKWPEAVMLVWVRKY